MPLIAIELRGVQAGKWRVVDAIKRQAGQNKQNQRKQPALAEEEQSTSNSTENSHKQVTNRSQSDEQTVVRGNDFQRFVAIARDFLEAACFLA